MPGGDRTGPAGMGPMTGRAAGYCAGYGTSGFANPVQGRGYGRGFGPGRRGGWGRRYGFYATGLPGWQQAAYGFPVYGGNMPYSPAPYTARVSKEDELNALKDQAEYFEDSLQGIKKRMAELEKESKGE